MTSWHSRMRVLGWPLRRVLNPRFEAVARQAYLAQEAAHAEGIASRQATAAVASTLEEHSEALLEMAEHFSARIDQAVAAIERIEVRLAERDGAGPVPPTQP